MAICCGDVSIQITMPVQQEPAAGSASESASRGHPLSQSGIARVFTMSPVAPYQVDAHTAGPDQHQCRQSVWHDAPCVVRACGGQQQDSDQPEKAMSMILTSRRTMLASHSDNTNAMAVPAVTANT